VKLLGKLYLHTQAAEGRAPVWGSEFTAKVATLQGVLQKSLLR